MGRSFSFACPEPIIRTEPEPEPYARWSAWNHFDPDSDEFFQDAEYEAFIDPVHLHPQRIPVTTVDSGSDSEPTSEGSHSGASSDGGQDSPIVPSTEISVILGEGHYNNRSNATRADTQSEWMERTSSPAPSVSLLPVHSPVPPRIDNPPFIPPAAFRLPTPDIADNPSLSIDPLPSTPLRRTVDIVPINVSRIRASPATRSVSPDSAISPSYQMTPPRNSQIMLTPSPAPPVTPRFYSWQNHPIPVLPTTPTIIRGNTRSTLTRGGTLYISGAFV